MTKTENEMKRVNIRVSSEIYEWFKYRSKKTGVSMSALMFLALESHVQQNTLIPQMSEMLKEMKEMEKKNISLREPV